MTVSVSALKALVEAGATAKMIVSLIEADQAALDAKRSKNAERMRAVRARARTIEHVHAQSSTQPAETIDMVPTIGSDVLNVDCAGEPPAVDCPSAAEQERKVSSHSSKERTPYLLPSSEDLFLEEERSSVVARTRSKRCATRLPEDWGPSAADLTFAGSLLRAGGVPIELDTFRDYWRARDGPGAVKRDWSATWRNWCRKAASNGGGYAKTHNSSGQDNRSLSEIARDHLFASANDE